MELDKETYLGYIKYQGKLVQDGYLDARRSADALIGIDSVVKYFLCQIDPRLQEIEFEVPVRIRKGSWEVLIPHNVEQWLIAAGGTGLTVYVSSALNKMAENDVGEKGFKDIIKQTFKSIKWVVSIACHIKSLAIKQFTEIDFKEEGGETLIGIPNEKGEVMFVPKYYLEQYRNCPDKLFSLLTKAIVSERELEIGTSDSEPLDTDEKFRSVKIGYSDKFIFTKEEDPDEVLFPDLKHNQYVELEGHVTRGNENSNTIGFEYLRHILTCTPIHGNIKEHKNLLFTNCLMKGYVDRIDKEGNFSEKKPKIRYIELLEISDKDTQYNIFEENTPS